MNVNNESNTTTPESDFEVQLTAYALGELEDDDARAIEARLETDADARRMVDDIRSTAGALGTALTTEPALELTADQRAAITAGPSAGSSEESGGTAALNAPSIFTNRLWWATGGLVAASLAIVLVAPALPSLLGRADTGEVAIEQSAKDDALRVTGQKEGRDERQSDGRSNTLADNRRAGEEASALGEAMAELDKSAAAPPPPASVAGSPVTRSGSAQRAPRASEPGAAGGRSSGGGGGGQIFGDPDPATPAPAPTAPAQLGSAVDAESTETLAVKPGLKNVEGSSSTVGDDVFAFRAEPGDGDGYTNMSWQRGRQSNDQLDPEGGRELGELPGALLLARGDQDADEINEIIEAFRAERAGVARKEVERQISNLGVREARKRLVHISTARKHVREDDQLQDQLRQEFDVLMDHIRQNTGQDANREAYELIVDNPFIKPTDEALSTFSIDVDTASYSNMRRMLTAGQQPPKDAVRIEEFINYFDYDYAPPAVDDPTPFAVHVEVNQAPWNLEHRLVKIGLKGKEIDTDMRPATNLVFLLDVSGSMSQPNKLPLVKKSMKMLLDRLGADDRIAIVVYAGAAGLVLDSTYVHDKATILAALENLRAGGSTNGGEGIELAYSIASEYFIEGGVNRVILCTDGDFNVGVSGDGALVRLIEEKRESDVFLSVLGFGTGNFQDAKMEKISNSGNGTFAYIDSEDEARKVLVDDLAGTLVTIAKDVKIQVDFNRSQVGAYRLIGYENRIMAARDFTDDTKDAGEIGAGHTVTALYEIVPPSDVTELAGAPKSRYAKPADDPAADVPAEISHELLTVKLRYKLPEGDASTPLEFPIVDENATLTAASSDFQFAAGVASFGMILRDSPYKGTATFGSVLDLVTPAASAPALVAAERDTEDQRSGQAEGAGLIAAKGQIDDRAGQAAARANQFRLEFLKLVEKARVLMPTRDQQSDQETQQNRDAESDSDDNHRSQPQGKSPRSSTSGTRPVQGVLPFPR